ncbi:MAG: ABC-2 transporter permease [Verrucomicrobia bacterium]|nr:ABC-2 transporter permease [Verrucomicrobiota bacterium]MDE3100095.1 ABC transporter permease [Verrucomicrobiota bacterium]
MRRDRVTFMMMIGIPIIQLILFGYAINSDPKRLPTAVYSADNGAFSRDIVWAMQNSGYFDVTRLPRSQGEIHELLAEGRVQFALTVPVDFSRKLLRGQKPELLLESDATDPMAVGYAMSAINALVPAVLNRDLTGPLARLRAASAPFQLITHAHYNPENVTQYNIVPGLMGVMLTMTMIIITGLAITRERERGTMENLLSTPVHPGEVILGKLAPYIAVGYAQVFLILLAAKFLFHVPIVGSVPLLVALTFLFIVANLAVGITFSTIAKNQLQAVQMAFFFFLPSLLLSGYMFPFRGMPGWAQDIGEILPLTHFLRIVRGILLKGNGIGEAAPDIWPIVLFLVVVLGIGIKRYRQTLD